MHSITKVMIHEDSNDITADEEVALIHSAPPTLLPTIRSAHLHASQRDSRVHR